MSWLKAEEGGEVSRCWDLKYIHLERRSPICSGDLRTPAGHAAGAAVCGLCECLWARPARAFTLMHAGTQKGKQNRKRTLLAPKWHIRVTSHHKQRSKSNVLLGRFMCADDGEWEKKGCTKKVFWRREGGKGKKWSMREEGRSALEEFLPDETIL